MLRVKASFIAGFALCFVLCASLAQAGSIWTVRIKNDGKETLTVRQVKSLCWFPGSFEKPSLIKPGVSQELFSEMDDKGKCNTGTNKEWYQEIEVKSAEKTYHYTFTFDKKRMRAKGDWNSLTCDAPSACCSACRVSIEID
jgi:hypothetical protein